MEHEGIKKSLRLHMKELRRLRQPKSNVMMAMMDNMMMTMRTSKNTLSIQTPTPISIEYTNSTTTSPINTTNTTSTSNTSNIAQKLLEKNSSQG